MIMRFTTVKNSSKNFIKNFRKFLLAFVVAVVPNLAAAQEVGECDWKSSAWNLVEPWDAYSRRFSNGQVRIALLDTNEPAAAALHLLVISPPYNEVGDAQCRVISWQGSLGFAQLDFDALTAAYDPATGLAFAIPGLFYSTEDNFSNSFQLHFTLNQSTGNISTEMELGLE